MLNLKTDDFENLFSSLTNKAPLIIAFTNDEDQLIYSISLLQRLRLQL